MFVAAGPWRPAGGGRMMLRIAPLLVLVPWLSACGSPNDELDTGGELNIGSAEQAVVHGEASDSADDGVVYVLSHEGNSGSACTGSLIAPNLVITALHCITYSNAGEFTCNEDGTLEASAGNDGRIGQLLPAGNVDIFSGSPRSSEPVATSVRLFGTGTLQICRNDLGLVMLDRDLDLPLLPIRLDAPVERGEFVRVVGYGQTETSGSSGRFQRAGRRVVDVGPDSDDQAQQSTAAPRTFVTNEGPCHGDSGGPAISEETGAVLGVYSLAAGLSLASCMTAGVRNVFTRANAFSTVVMDAFTAAGHEPLLEDVTEAPTAKPKSSGCALNPAAKTPGPLTLTMCGGLLGMFFWRRRSAASKWL